MSSYFARLVQRASGVVQGTHAAPVAQAAPTISDARDPFEASAPPKTSPTPFAPAQSPLSRENTIGPAPVHERQELPSPAALPQPLFPMNPPTISEPVTGRVAEVQRETELSESHPPPLTKDVEKHFETIRHVEHAVVEREITRELLQPSAPKLPPVVASPPRPALPKLELSAEPEKSAIAPPATFSSMPAKLEVHHLLEPAITERIVHPTPAVPPREEPRLVIGRMQVEVVPPPPVMAPQPRVRESARRHVAPRQAAAPSRSYFGLGQM